MIRIMFIIRLSSSSISTLFLYRQSRSLSRASTSTIRSLSITVLAATMLFLVFFMSMRRGIIMRKRMIMRWRRSVSSLIMMMILRRNM